MILSKILCSICLVLCVTVASLNAQSVPGDTNRTTFWAFEATIARGFFLHSPGAADVLGYDSSDRKPVGDYTMRYGTSFEVLRNSYAYKTAPQTDFDSSDEFRLSASRKILPWLHLGLDAEHVSYRIANMHMNVRQYTNPYNQFNILTFGVISFPTLRDAAVNGELLDPILLHNGWPINTITAGTHVAFHFSEGNIDPFLKVTVGVGKDLYRPLSTFEYGASGGLRVFVSERVFVTTEAGIRLIQFNGHAGGRTVSPLLREPSFRAGAGFTR